MPKGKDDRPVAATWCHGARAPQGWLRAPAVPSRKGRDALDPPCAPRPPDGVSGRGASFAALSPRRGSIKGHGLAGTATAQASSPWPLGWTTVTASRCRLAARFRLGGPPHGPQRAVQVQRPGLRLRHHAVEMPPAVVRKCAGFLVDTTASAIAAPDPPVGSVAICVLAAWFSTRPIPRPLCRPRTVDA